jgi:hypothetical protein
MEIEVTQALCFHRLQRDEHTLAAEPKHGLAVHTTQVHRDLLLMSVRRTFWREQNHLMELIGA